jgi:hypothetical protein
MASAESFWIDLSIREIFSQARYADLAYSDVVRKAELLEDGLFSSIQAFLSHCAMISKMLKRRYNKLEGRSIGDMLGISDNSFIHRRQFRDYLEHYDEKLLCWIKQLHQIGFPYLDGTRQNNAIGDQNITHIRNYDRATCTLTLVGEDFDLSAMHAEATRIKEIADRWIESQRKPTVRKGCADRAPPVV